MFWDVVLSLLRFRLHFRFYLLFVHLLLAQHKSAPLKYLIVKLLKLIAQRSHFKNKKALLAGLAKFLLFTLQQFLETVWKSIKLVSFCAKLVFTAFWRGRSRSNLVVFLPTVGKPLVLVVGYTPIKHWWFFPFTWLLNFWFRPFSFSQNFSVNFGLLGLHSAVFVFYFSSKLLVLV